MRKFILAMCVIGAFGFGFIGESSAAESMRPVDGQQITEHHHGRGYSRGGRRGGGWHNGGGYYGGGYGCGW